LIINRFAAEYQVGNTIGQALAGARQALLEPFELWRVRDRPCLSRLNSPAFSGLSDLVDVLFFLKPSMKLFVFNLSMND